MNVYNVYKNGELVIENEFSKMVAKKIGTTEANVRNSANYNRKFKDYKIVKVGVANEEHSFSQEYMIQFAYEWEKACERLRGRFQSATK